MYTLVSVVQFSMARPSRGLRTRACSSARGTTNPFSERPAFGNGYGHSYSGRKAQKMSRMRLRVSASPKIHYFVPSLTALILKVTRDRKFPKGPSTQIRFIVDAIAARGRVAPRRSIDISQQERAGAASAHQIIPDASPLPSAHFDSGCHSYLFEHVTVGLDSRGTVRAVMSKGRDPLGDSPPKDEPQFGAGLTRPSGRTRCRDPVG